MSFIINPFVFAAAGSPSVPLSLSPGGWWDLSDASTLYDATSGGSLVAADGQIARIEDKSGNSRHATQATSASRALRKTAVQNGLDTALFDGSNDWFDLPNFLSGSSGSVFYVFKLQAGNQGAMVSQWGSVGGTGGTEDSDGFSGQVYHGWGSNSRKSAGTPSPAFTAWNIASIESSAGLWAYRNNTNLLYSTASNTVAWGTAPRFARSNNLYTGGWLGEVIYFPTVLGSTDRTAVLSYLKTKWGTP